MVKQKETKRKTYENMKHKNGEERTDCMEMKQTAGKENV
jgi:hypothetical protein